MLSTDLVIGAGAEEQIMTLSLGLRARGWQVGIISLVPPGHLPARIKSSDIAIASLNMRRGVPAPRALFMMVRHLQRFRPDVLHSHMAHANLLARIARILYPVPVLINTLHSTTMEKINGGSGRELAIAHRLTDRLADLTTVVCRAAEQHYLRTRTVREGRIAVRHNGVDADRFRFDPVARRRVRTDLGIEEFFVWLAAGRFERAKDYPSLIRAFAQLISRRSEPAVLLICGQGSLDSQLRLLVRECGIAQHVRFLGVRSDLSRIFSAADAFAMSSVIEGLPMVLLEASASGRPIVATEVGGNSEVVVDGKTGFLVAPEDPSALSRAMERLMRLTPAERGAMGAAARLHVEENFAIQTVLDRWEMLYLELIRDNTDKH